MIITNPMKQMMNPIIIPAMIDEKMVAAGKEESTMRVSNAI